MPVGVEVAGPVGNGVRLGLCEDVAAGDAVVVSVGVWWVGEAVALTDEVGVLENEGIGNTTRTRSLPESQMYTRPVGSTATPTGFDNCATLAGSWLTSYVSPLNPPTPLPAIVERTPRVSMRTR